MAITTVVFTIMTFFYTYVTPRGNQEKENGKDMKGEVEKIPEKVDEDHPDFTTMF